MNTIAKVIVVSGTGLACSAHAQTVLWLRMETGIPGSTASAAHSVLDSSGKGHHATPIGGPIWRRSWAAPGAKCLSFDGQNDRLFVADHSDFETPAFTVEAYVRLMGLPPSTWPQAQFVFRGDDRAAFDTFTLGVLPDGRPIFFFDDASGLRSNLVGATPLPLGRWFHIAARFDPATLRQSLLVNHEEAGFAITPLRPVLALTGGNAGVAVGNIANAGPQYLNGQVAEVRISATALGIGSLLPVPCNADYTATAIPGQAGYGVPDHVLSSEDFFFFLSAFAGGDLEMADLTNSSIPGQPGYGLPNGSLGTDDFFYYLSLYAAGC